MMVIDEVRGKRDVGKGNLGKGHSPSVAELAKVNTGMGKEQGETHVFEAKCLRVRGRDDRRLLDSDGCRSGGRMTCSEGAYPFFHGGSGGSRGKKSSQPESGRGSRGGRERRRTKGRKGKERTSGGLDERALDERD